MFQHITIDQEKVNEKKIVVLNKKNTERCLCHF